MFAWDDLQLVLAIARAQNLNAAAVAMGVSHSTVFRKLNTLEERLGCRLFERLATGYELTDSGIRVMEAAERIEAETLTLERDVTGRDTRLTGYLRVTCSETLALRFITPEIARFRAARPGIIVDLLVDNRMLDLSRRETDVALRAERPTQGDFLGRKLSNIEWALFADPAYVDKRTAPKNLRALQHHSFIGWADPAPPMKAVAWVKRHVPPESIKFRTNTLVNQMNAAREGLGIALLPTYLVTDATRLIRVSAPLRTIMTELWIITHRSLKDTARIRNFMDFVGAGIKSRMSAVLTTEAD